MSLRTTARLTGALAALSLLVAVAASPVAGQSSSPGPVGPPAATPIADPPRIPAGDGTGVRLQTDKGDIVIGLFTETAPVASENFLNLVRSGFYDGLTFHRLAPGFVIQGGDPNGDGSGGPGYTIPDEPVVGRYERGIVAMARKQVPNSQGSQFFIVLDDSAGPILESYRTFSIFGRVLEGMDAVDAIAAMPNSGDPENRALEPVHILKATVEQVTMPPEPDPGAGAPSAPLGDKELEGRLPAAVGGAPLQLISFTGDEIVAQLDPNDPLNAIRDVVAGTGRQLSDFSVASGQADLADGFVGVVAARIKGGDPQVLADRLPELLFRFGNGTSSTKTVAGTEVTVIAPGEGAPTDQALNVWTSGEIAWFAIASDAHLEEIVAASLD